METIDLTSKISKYFTWKEALWLPTWNRAAIESDGLDQTVIDNLKSLFEKMDIVREYFGCPIIVHVTYRPEAYNKLIGGSPKSSHRTGMAIDFHVKGVTCEDARARINKDGKLAEWQMRMEDIDGNWIHLDTRAPGPGGRFFKP